MTKSAKKFKRAAQKPEEPVFDFGREVAQVWHDFPEVKDTVFFFDASDNARLVYPEEGAEKEAAQKLAEEYDAEDLMESVFSKWGEKNSFCQSLHGDKRLLFILMEKHPYDKISPIAPPAQETAFVFDHELGHAIIPDGNGWNRNRSECIADAYATIRHLQRYGTDSSFIDHVVNNRSFDLVFRERWYGRDHFTSSVTEKILARRHDTDWAALTPRQTTQLARKFALEHEMASEALNMLEEDFRPLHERADNIARGDMTPLKELAQKVLSTDSSDVFKYGTAALALHIDQRMVDSALQGEYWHKVRKKLAKKNKKMTKKNKAFVPRKPNARKI